MFKTIVTFALLIAAASAHDPATEELFQTFQAKYNKNYTSLEYGVRYEYFKNNMAAAADRPTAGMTKFADLSPVEFKILHTGRTAATPLQESWDGECTACKRFPEHLNLSHHSNAGNFDWTTKGAVTGVKNQADCGSCWSFGTTGDIEGTWFLAGHNLQSLSEQELVSCDKTDGGCQGGLQEDAFAWIIKKGGLVAENTYPYTSGRNNKGGRCKKNKLSPVVSSISSWYQVSSSSAGEQKILEQLAKVGPITIGINAGPMQMYTGGIDNPKNCNPQSLDHAVLIVGYGTEGGVDYWKIKNSWGTDFGEKGYYRIVRGRNACGLANDAVHSKV